MNLSVLWFCPRSECDANRLPLTKPLMDDGGAARCPECKVTVVQCDNCFRLMEDVESEALGLYVVCLQCGFASPTEPTVREALGLKPLRPLRASVLRAVAAGGVPRGERDRQRLAGWAAGSRVRLFGAAEADLLAACISGSVDDGTLLAQARTFVSEQPELLRLRAAAEARAAVQESAARFHSGGGQLHAVLSSQHARSQAMLRSHTRPYWQLLVAVGRRIRALHAEVVAPPAPPADPAGQLLPVLAAPLPEPCARARHQAHLWGTLYSALSATLT